MKKYFVIPLFLTLLSSVVFAQQENQFTLLNSNALFYNPAFTGLEGYWNVGTTYRKQWTGFDQSPRIVGIYAHGRFSEENVNKGKPPFMLRASRAGAYDSVSTEYTETVYTNHAMGGYLIHDQYGPFRDLSAALTYAYHLPISNTFKWTFGASVGVSNKKINANDLDVVNPNDVTFNQYEMEGDRSEFNFDLGLGMVVYSENLYVGLGVKQFLNQVNFENDSLAGVPREPHYYLGAGYVINITDAVELYPSAMVRYVNEVPVDVDVILKSRIKHFLVIGAGYQRDDTALGIIGVNINNSFNVTYSYGYQFGQMRSVQHGNHAINLNVALYNWSNKPPRLMW